MIFLDQRVKASGPKNAQLAAIGMAPAKWELGIGRPFSGPSGKELDEALWASKIARDKVYVTNLVSFFIDDNDLYSVSEEILERERQRVFTELEEVKPNCLLIMGAQTLVLLMEGYVGPFGSKSQKKASEKWGITKWRGSIVTLKMPSGRLQKCVVAMHPAVYLRGQWKWKPIYKYIDVPRAVTQSSFPEVKLTQRTAITGPSFRTACEWLHHMNQQEWVSIDYEGRSHITCLGSGSTANEALCIPLSRVGSPSYWSLSEEVHLWQLWSKLLQNPNVKKIAQNAPFEWFKSWMYGIYPNPLGLDTMHAHHCLYPDFGGITDEWSSRKRDIDNPGHGLAFITSQYTDQPFYKDDGRHWTPDLGEIKFWEYNCIDVMVTFEAAMKMMAELKAAGLWETYIKKYHGEFEPSIRMEWYGVQIDVEKREAASKEILSEVDTLSKQLSDEIGKSVITRAHKKSGKVNGQTLNLGSSPQMLSFLQSRGHKPRINKKTGKPTADADTLKMLAPKDPVIWKMLKMKQLQDLHNDVIMQKLDEFNRIHCHNKIGGTNGTRWSSSKSILGTGTNLQNLPRQGVARSLFLPN